MASPKPQQQAREQQPAQQKRRAPASFDREHSLRRLEDLVRANPTPAVVQQAVQAMLLAGELDFSDLPAIEALLAGVVGHGAKPRATTPKPKRFHELPEAEQADWEARLRRDAETLKAKAREWYVSESDEDEICALVERWVAEDEKGGFGGTLMDRFILRAADKTFTKGLFDVTTTSSDELKRRMSDKGRARLIAALKKGKALGRYADEKPQELPSFWKDVVAKTVVGLPGGVTSFTGGVLQSLPLPYMEEAGDWLHEQGKEYLTTVGYSKEEAETVGAGERMFGRVWGEGMQVVAGVGALGKAAKAGELAKAGLTGAKAAKYAEATSKVVQIAEDVNAFYKENKTLIDYTFKVATDLLAKKTEGKEITADVLFQILYERALKEVLSKMGEGPEGALKKDESAAFKDSVANRKGGDAAETQAGKYEAHADTLRGRSAEMKEAGQRGYAGPNNLAAYKDKQAEIEHENAQGLSKASRKKLVAYLLRNVLRRLLVNIVYTFAREMSRATAKGLDSTQALADMRSRAKNIMIDIGVSTIREVVTDLFVNYLFADLGKMANSLDIAKEGMKLCIDGVTNVVFVWVKESIVNAAK